MTLAHQDGGDDAAPVTVTNFPRRTLSACLPGLVHGNYHITVYSRLRSPGGAGALIGHNVARLMAPNIIARSGILGNHRGGFLTTVRFNGNDVNITLLSVSANRFLISRNAGSCVRGLLSGFSPGRILCSRDCHRSFERCFNRGFYICRLRR